MSERDVRARPELPAVLRYGVAVASVAVALIATLSLGPTVFEGPVFFLAVILSGWLGGGRAGLVAAVLSTVAVAYFFLPPSYDLRVDPPNRIPLLLFLLSAVLASRLSSVTRRTLVQLQRARDDLDAKVEERTADLTAANTKLRERAALLDLTHDTVFARDMRDVITYWNRGANELYGWKQDEVVGRTSHDVLHTVFPAPLSEINRTLLDTGRWEGQLIHTKRDGSKVVAASRWALQRDQRGNPVAILETNNDVTEQRAAEEALRESEEQWRAVFENNPTMYFMVAAGGTILSVNPFGAEQLGYTVDELIGRPVLDVFHEADRQGVERNVAACLAQPGRVWSWEFRKVRKDGTVLWAREMARVMPLKGRAVVLIVCEDITERKRAAEALQKAEAELAHVARVTTMGELASSIAHEVNQPLAAVTTNGNAGLRWLAADPPNLDETRGCLNRIIRDGVRASEIIARIRGLVKKSVAAKERLDVSEMIQEVLAMADTEARRHRVAVRAEGALDMAVAWGDRIQLQQVILNLVINAIDAMKAVGNRPRELLIRWERHEPDTILVTVRDSGVGLDPQAMDRIFDAFYTTKPGGLGMGLSISRSIIEAHGGRLWATANDHHGATFQFSLPTSGGEADD